jgi:hypothetical protein
LAINFIADHDTCRQASIRVPTGSPDRSTAESVPFDAPSAAVAWEERTIVDRSLFRSFAERAAKMLRPLVAEPLLAELWPLADGAATRGATLGTALAQARHAYEGTLGLQTLEVPLSRLCRSEAFAWFAAWLLAEAPRVRSVYNAAVQAYRAANRVRSATHPVPDLAKEGELFESPLWVWSRSDPRRRHLFVQFRSGGMVLTDREAWTCEIPGVGDGSPLAAVERLLALDEQGIRLRPRALTTTWYARVLLSDLFVHGIGGAKYDEVTDRIIAELFQISPPAYLTATATLHLPVAHETDAGRRLRTLRSRRRDLRFHAEAAAAGEGDAFLAAARAKRECIDEFRAAASSQWQRDAARQRHQAVIRANAALAPWAAEELRCLDVEEASLKERLRGQQLLESREHAFCLFPRETIVPSLSALAGGHG